MGEGAGDLIFKASLQLDGAEEVLKKLEGSLPRIGVAAQKEYEKAGGAGAIKEAKKVGSMFQQLGENFISRSMAPMMTAQEARAGAYKDVAGIVGKIPIIGAALAAPLQAAAQYSGYVHTGAKEQTMSYAEQMGMLDIDVSDEVLENMQRREETRRKKGWAGRQKGAAAAERASTVTMDEELAVMAQTFEKGITTIKRQFGVFDETIKKTSSNVNEFNYRINKTNTDLDKKHKPLE